MLILCSIISIIVDMFLLYIAVIVLSLTIFIGETKSCIASEKKIDEDAKRLGITLEPDPLLLRISKRIEKYFGLWD